MCRSHYSLTNKSSKVTNESTTVSTTKPSTESSTVTNYSITVTNQLSTVITNKSSTVTNEPYTVTNKYMCTVSNKASTVTNKSSRVMEIDIVIQQVMEFVGMGNWEQVHTFTAVCKLWRYSCLPHLSNIGKVPMDGGAERRLNVGVFLRYLQSEHFRNVQCILIPCRSTKGLLVNDMKQPCPSVQTIVHSKWLFIHGRIEETQEGEGCHQCYRVYWHDMGFTEGKNVWVQFTWDKKCKFVLECCLLCLIFL
jgi:hypothetical protein